MRTRDLVISPEGRLQLLASRVRKQQDVINLLEDMAPELLRINVSGAEAAARVALRLRAQMSHQL